MRVISIDEAKAKGENWNFIKINYRIIKKQRESGATFPKNIITASLNLHEDRLFSHNVVTMETSAIGWPA